MISSIMYFKSPSNQFYFRNDLYKISKTLVSFNIYDSTGKKIKYETGKNYSFYKGDSLNFKDVNFKFKIGKYDSIRFFSWYPNPTDIKYYTPSIYKSHLKYYKRFIDKFDFYNSYFTGYKIITYALYKQGNVEFYSELMGKKNIIFEFDPTHVFVNNQSYNLKMIKYKGKKYTNTHIFLVSKTNTE